MQRNNFTSFIRVLRAIRGSIFSVIRALILERRGLMEIS
jgi:hypothetical protein